MSRQMLFVWVVVIIVIIGGVYWWVNSSSSAPAVSNTPPTSQNEAPMIPATSTPDTNATSSSMSAMSATVTYDGTSFSPSNVTIMQGGTVTFTDTSANPMWIASNPHPTHTGYDGTSRSQHCAAGYTGSAPFDECAPGTSFTFTFTKVGTWGYHNHLNDPVHGTVTVVAQ